MCKHVQCGYMQYSMCVCTCIVCMFECASISFYLYLCQKDCKKNPEIEKVEWEDGSLVP